jgi:hypothetical protein
MTKEQILERHANWLLRQAGFSKRGRPWKEEKRLGKERKGYFDDLEKGLKRTKSINMGIARWTINRKEEANGTT